MIVLIMSSDNRADKWPIDVLTRMIKREIFLLPSLINHGNENQD